jgi:aspartate aminotransferase
MEMTDQEWIKEDLRSGTGSANLDFNHKIKQLRAQGEKIYHLGFGQCPFPVPDEAIQELQTHAHRSTYTPMAGIPELKRSILEFHKRFDGVTTYDVDRIICGPGSKELIYQTLNALETTVVILKPAWPTYMPQTRLANKKVIQVDRKFENAWRLTADDLEKALKDNSVPPKSIMILTNPDNPTGCVYSPEDLQSISEVCRKFDLIVLSDEIYAQCCFDGHRNLRERYKI